MSTPDHAARWQQPTLPDIQPFVMEPVDDDDSGLVWVIDDEGEYLAEVIPHPSDTDDGGTTP